VAVTVTLGDAELLLDEEELPPQPDRLKAAIIAITYRQTTALILRPESTKPFLKSNTGASGGRKINSQVFYNTCGIHVNREISTRISILSISYKAIHFQLPLRDLFTSV
jgi:hypothetical protein